MVTAASSSAIHSTTHVQVVVAPLSIVEALFASLQPRCLPSMLWRSIGIRCAVKNSSDLTATTALRVLYNAPLSLSPPRPATHSSTASHTLTAVGPASGLLRRHTSLLCGISLPPPTAAFCGPLRVYTTTNASAEKDGASAAQRRNSRRWRHHRRGGAGQRRDDRETTNDAKKDVAAEPQSSDKKTAQSSEPGAQREASNRPGALPRQSHQMRTKTEDAPMRPSASRPALDAVPHTLAQRSAASSGFSRGDCRPLRQLLRDHSTLLQNFKTMGLSPDIANTVERLCAAALARSGLVESLAAAFTQKVVEEDARPRGSASPSAARLMLTYVDCRPMNGVPDSATTQRQPPPEALEAWTVPQEVVEWLRSPIDVPALSMADLSACVDRQCAERRAAEQHEADALLSSGDNANGRMKASQHTTAHSVELWYKNWGELKLSAPGVESAAADTSSPSDAQLWKFMALWFERHVVVSAALLPRFVPGVHPSPHVALQGSMSGANRENKKSGDAERRHREAARRHDAPRDATTTAVTRPDETVHGDLANLLDTLYQLLSTLSAFKRAIEEGRFAAAQAARRASLKENSGSDAREHVANTLDLAPRDDSSKGEASSAAAAAELTHNISSSDERGGGTSAALSTPQEPPRAAIEERCQPLVSSVDVLYSVPFSFAASAVDADAVLAAASSTHAQVPVYTAAALDVVMGVLMRCLVFYLPALQPHLRGRLMRLILRPWTASVPCAPAATWGTLFGLTEALSGTADTSQHLRSATQSEKIAESLLNSSEAAMTPLIRMLRMLCSRFLTVNVSGNHASLAAWDAAAKAGMLHSVDSLEQRQGTGYELLVFVAFILSRENVLSFAAPSATARCTRAHHHLALECLQVFRTDRSLSGKAPGRGGHAELMQPTQLGSVDVTPAPRLPCVDACMLQMKLPFGLTRSALSAFAAPLMATYAKRNREQQQVVMDAIRSAVVSPLATVFYTTAEEAAEREGLEVVSSVAQLASSVEWQASAPALSSLTQFLTQGVWVLMWSSVAAELANFPVQMRAMLQSSQATQKETAGTRSEGASAAPAGQRASGMDSALRACWTELRELAVLCAWLLVASERVFATSTDAAKEVPAGASSALAEKREGVRTAFGDCVKGILGVWTETGALFGASRQLLRLFSCRAQLDSAAAVADAPGARLLVKLTQSSASHLWTAELEALVRKWVAQMEPEQSTVASLSSSTAVAAVTTGGVDPAAADARHTIKSDIAGQSVSGPRHLKGLEDADSCFISWWRSLEAEEVGLPSSHIYLLQVYQELTRIVELRGASQSATTNVSNEANVDEEREEVAASSAAAATVPTASPTPLFSAAELIVLLRVLASISMRPGVSTASNSDGSGIEWSQLSILDALKQVALSSATAAASETTVAELPGATATKKLRSDASVATKEKASTLEEAPPATADPAAGVVRAMQLVEKALLGSVRCHLSALPAVSLLEAVWLGLHPFIDLTERLSSAPSGLPCGSGDSMATPLSSPFSTDLSPHSDGTKPLHFAICTDAHTRLLCCFVVFRHYSLVRRGDAAAGRVSRVRDEEDEDVKGALQLSNEEQLSASPQLERLGHFLRQLRSSCAEAFTASHDAAEVLSAAATGGDALLSRLARLPSTSPPSDETAEREGGATSHKEHARGFLRVSVLGSELHCRLANFEAARLPSLVMGASVATACVSEHGVEPQTTIPVQQQQRELRRLYAALLAAVEAFVPLGERGRCVEVLQLVSGVTWRMRRLRVLTLTGNERESQVDYASAAAFDTPCDSAVATRLLQYYRAVVEALLPQVEAEMLYLTRSNTVSTVRAVLALSAKTATEEALRGIPVLPAAPCPPSTSEEEEGGTSDFPAVPGGGTAILSEPRQLHSDLSLATRPLWSKLPLREVFYRAVSAAQQVHRFEDVISAMVMFAPELADAFLPAAGATLRQVAHRSPAKIELLFISIIMCTTLQHAQDERELNARLHTSVLRAVLPVAADSKTEEKTAEISEGSPSLASSSSTTPFSDESSAAALSGSDMRLAQQLSFPVHRASAALATIRLPAGNLRRVWSHLVRDMLSHADDGAASSGATDHTSLWVTALYCGGVLKVADSNLFEQLFACFVYNNGDEGSDVSTSLGQLNAAGWTLVIKACAAATDHQHRQCYREELKGSLTAYVQSVDAGQLISSYDSPFLSPFDALLATGPALCGLLEALPSLFIADESFWATTVKPAVERWCAAVRDGGKCVEEPEASRHGGMQWVAQLQLSFNWAVRCAGHPSLVFEDVWTEPSQRSEVEVLLQKLEDSLREL